ncbi:MAG: DNA replication/repair protein RecF [bacterium]
MMLSSLLARNFRVFQEINLTFEPGMQLFLGRNAQGKTSLIEAVLFLATSLSHRTRREDELIRWGETAAFLRGITEGPAGERVIECGLEKKRKALKIDGKPLPRVGDLYGCLRTVLFAPEDLAIVGGGPLERRRFLDMAIAQLDPGYIPLLQNYRRALRHRNHLLKRLQTARGGPGWRELETWDQPFVEYAVQVVRRRVETLERLGPLVKHYYSGLADDGPLEITYSPRLEPDPEAIRTYLQERMIRGRPAEIERGSTLSGPHRDDLLLELAGKNLGWYGSQGQRRAAALALRLGEARLSFEGTDEWPLLLIDDVVYEMDNTRRTRFWDRMETAGQLLVTATEREHLGAGVKPARIFRVEHGSIYPDGA